MKHTIICVGIGLALTCSAVFAGDGDLDGTFGQDGRQTVAFDLGVTNWDQLVGLHLDVDGRILLTGSVENDAGSGVGIARLTPDGKPDDTFVPVFYRNLAHLRFFPFASVLQADGRLVVAGSSAFTFINSDAAVCRFLADGKIDLGFGDPVTPGCRAIDIGPSDTPSAMLIQQDGMIVLVGGTYDLNLNTSVPMAIRLDSAGVPDDSFGDAGIKVFEELETSFSLDDVALSPKGDLVALAASAVNGDADYRVVRLRSKDGELDSTFDDDGIVDIAIGDGEDYPSALRVGSDGAITIAGNTSVGNDLCQVAVKLDALGTVDTAFDGDGIYIDEECGPFGVRSLHIQEDGKIVLLGNFEGDAGFRTVRLMPEGGRDDTYGDKGASVVSFPGVLSYQPARIIGQGEQLLIAGSVQNDGIGEFDFGIARLGTLDDSIFEHDFELPKP